MKSYLDDGIVLRNANYTIKFRRFHGGLRGLTILPLLSQHEYGPISRMVSPRFMEEEPQMIYFFDVNLP